MLATKVHQQAASMRMRTEDEGLTAAETTALVAIAPLAQWGLQWDDQAREWVTAVTCPSCGEHLQYEVGALTDFHCSVCEYDWLDEDGPRKLPAPANL